MGSFDFDWVALQSRILCALSHQNWLNNKKDIYKKIFIKNLNRE